MTREEIESVEELIPLRKGGAMIGVPYETMRRYVKLRTIPYYKIGGRLKVHKQEIRDWYNARKILPLDSTAKNRCEVNRHDNFRSQEKGSQSERIGNTKALSEEILSGIPAFSLEPDEVLGWKYRPTTRRGGKFRRNGA